MKRRNVDATKHRKQFHFRKCKFTESMSGSSTFLYLKFLLIWGLIMIADYLVEFRFEFLWPLWLLVRSIHDSFKYQGLIFSIFFALIAFLSDLFCYMFIPVQWLFFASSTYVWVQYVWHTEKGICLPTISLWLLFVYIEASVRLKSLKTIDLCRPFAAHCIGYPMVTLGFGLKSYISYRLRLRKQKEIRKVNEFYTNLLGHALPPEVRHQPSQSQSQATLDKQLKQAVVVTSDDDLMDEHVDSATSSSSTNNSYSLSNSCNTLIHAFKCKYFSSNNNNINRPTGSSSTSSSSNQISASKATPKIDTSTKLAADDSLYLQQKDLISSKYKEYDTATNCPSKSPQPSTTTTNSTNTTSTSSACTASFSKSKTTTFTANGTFNSKVSASSPSPSPSPPTPPQQQSPLHSTNHTNININMTINATAIATATANNTTTQNTSTTSIVHNNLINSSSSPNLAQNSPSSGSNNASTSSSGNATPSDKQSTASVSGAGGSSSGAGAAKKAAKVKEANAAQLLIKEDFIKHLEDDVNKLQQELQQQKTLEQYLRGQLSYAGKCERSEKLKLDKLQQEHESLQKNFNKLSAQRQKDKETKDELEKKLGEEKKARAAVEVQLSGFGGGKQVLATSQTVNNFQNRNGENAENQRQRLKELESENRAMHDKVSASSERVRELENECASLVQYRDTQKKIDSLVNTLKMVEQKNSNLQESLSSETRFKLDLFSALGDSRRQLDAVTRELLNKDKELSAMKYILKSTITDPNFLQGDLLPQIFALVNGPSQSVQSQHPQHQQNLFDYSLANTFNSSYPFANGLPSSNQSSNSNCSSPLFDQSQPSASQQQTLHHQQQQQQQYQQQLDAHASVYTPKL